jgi:hypothetical protein
MAWTNLKTNYTDASWSGNKKYTITNKDNSTSFNAEIQDDTVYTNEQDSFFGASDANAMNGAINDIMNGTASLAGAKTFTSTPTFSDNNSSPGFRCSPKNNPAANSGWQWMAMSQTNGVYRTDHWVFGEYSYDSSTGAALNTYEGYRLPTVDADLGSVITYNILTSKAPVTIAQGGSGQAAVTTGTFTPVVKYSDDSTLTIAGTPKGRYYKWGPLVHYEGYFQITNLGETGSKYLQISGFPHSLLVTYNGAGVPLHMANASSDNVPNLIYIMDSTTLRVVHGPQGAQSRNYLQTGWCSFDLWAFTE